MKPILLTLPGLDWEMQSYGFFAAVALVFAWISTLRLSQADGFDPGRTGPIFVGSAAAGLIAARGAWVVQHPEAFEGLRSLVTLRAGTLAPFAGVLVMLVIGGAWISRQRVSAWAWYDVLAPGFAIGTVLERLGALLSGVGFGRYAPDAAFAVRFPVGSPAFDLHRRTLANLMRTGATESLPVHPTQLYAMGLGLLGLGLCVVLRKRRTFSGQVFLGFAAYFVVARVFVEEFLRADASTAISGPFNGGQLGGLVMLSVIGIVYATRRRRARAGDASVAPGVPKSQEEARTRARGTKPKGHGSSKSKKGKRG